MRPKFQNNHLIDRYIYRRANIGLNKNYQDRFIEILNLFSLFKHQTRCTISNIYLNNIDNLLFHLDSLA